MSSVKHDHETTARSSLKCFPPDKDMLSLSFRQQGYKKVM